MITKKQYELLIYLNDYIVGNGVCPSFDEMRDALGLKSKSGVHRLISGLVERKFLKKLPNRARALEVVRLPEDRDRREKPVAGTGGIGGTALAKYAAKPAGLVQIPLYGRIVPGSLIESLNQKSQTIDVPAHMIGIGEHYALAVGGGFMAGDGILEGDLVVVRRTGSAENDRLAVVMIDGYEAALTRFKRKGAGVELSPFGKKGETKTFAVDRVLVQGVLAGLLRRYS